MLKNFVNLELLLGSNKLSPKEKKKLLTKLAFIQYVLNDDLYIPHIYPFNPTGQKYYPGYVNGTPNMKICLFTTRGIMAAMLKNHPEFKKWTDQAMDDFYNIVAVSITKSGAHLESPFYSSRDTMRYGPFWAAMKRTGVLKNNAMAQKWEKRLKKCYTYMGDMLTIPDPRYNYRRAYHAIGRSSSGIVDPTIMISGTPFGEDDPKFLSRQRWCWDAQGKPSFDCVGTAGGRNMSLTMLASLPVTNAKPAKKSPLKSIRYKGMGLIGRSQVGTKYESNILFRHDPFCWDLYEGNNGAVYFWGKGAPLSIRFGGYWDHHANLMSFPFGNRLLFDKGNAKWNQKTGFTPGWDDAVGNMTDYCLMDGLADYGKSITRDKDWQREVLFVKDINKEDPLFLLVRDDTFRKNSGSAIHWWIMSKDVMPNGVENPGVLSGKDYTNESWFKNIGHNWKKAPKLKGQYHRFKTNFNVDLDMYIASPANPKIISDAAGVSSKVEAYSINKKVSECQQLIRIEQPEGKHYLTLMSPVGKNAKPRTYKTIANDYGVIIDTTNQQNRLFLAPKKISYKDKIVKFDGKVGFCRTGPGNLLRMMIIDGTIEAQGFKISSEHGKTGLLFDGKYIKIFTSNKSDLEFLLPENIKNIPVKIVQCEDNAK